MRNVLPIFAAVALVGASTQSVAARQLSADEALNIVENQRRAALPNRAPVKQMQLQRSIGPEEEPDLYVFGHADKPGFMIVAADDRVGNLLLAYSDNSSFTEGALPENVEWWLSTYSRAVDAARRGEMVTLGSESTERTDIAPMVKTLWNQETPYNNLCPIDPSSTSQGRCPTGCVATAMAQVMKYHGYPAQGRGEHSYRCKNVGQTLSMNFGETTFDWDDMLLQYNEGDYTPQQARAVATLMYAVGVATDMEYGPTGSGSNYFEGAEGLVTYFGYDRGMQVLERDYYTLDEWTSTIYNELQQERPVLYGGANSEDGHAFVCDGYQGGYFHFNWGWGGMSNGYFQVTALNPMEQGVGGSASGYNAAQNILIGVQPEREGAVTVPSILFMSSFQLGEMVVKRHHDSHVEVVDTAGIASSSIGEIEISLGLKLVGEDGETRYVKGDGFIKLDMGQGVRGYYVPAGNFPERGSYTVTPAFCDRSEQWYDARVPLGECSKMRVECSKHELKFTALAAPKPAASGLSLDTPLYLGSQFKVSATLSVSEGEYYGQVAPILMFEGQEVAAAAPIAVDIVSGEPQQYVWISSFSASVYPYSYQLGLVSEQGDQLCDPIDVNVYESVGTEGVQVPSVIFGTARSGNGTAGDPAIVDPADFSATMMLECESEYFAQNVAGYVFYDQSTVIKIVGGEFVWMTGGETQQLTVKGNLDDLEPDHVYIFVPWASVQGQCGDPWYFKIEPSALRSVKADGAESLTLYPNPATDLVNVSSEAAIAELNIYSLGGMQVKAVKGDGAYRMSIDISGLAKGLYMVEAVSGDGAVAVRRLVKQ